MLFPRGVDELDVLERARVEQYMLDHIDALLPGFLPTIHYQRFISPREFQKLHNLNSSVTAAIIPPGFQKPDNYDPDRDIYYVGNTVRPTCEHATSAVASGLRAADMIHKSDIRRRT
ncbi:hypothetical protein ACQPW1_09675 [Nocardia sp. CA-128927]|uniref:hypothetical protein n=1 Tax=Nocardia sp. CA-128927 TaxID=3239975 RepID=UPI003D99E713